MVGAFTLHMYW